MSLCYIILTIIILTQIIKDNLLCTFFLFIFCLLQIVLKTLVFFWWSSDIVSMTLFLLCSWTISRRHFLGKVFRIVYNILETIIKKVFSWCLFILIIVLNLLLLNFWIFLLLWCKFGRLIWTFIAFVICFLIICRPYYAL